MSGMFTAFSTSASNLFLKSILFLLVAKCWYEAIFGHQDGLKIRKTYLPSRKSRGRVDTGDEVSRGVGASHHPACYLRAVPPGCQLAATADGLTGKWQQCREGKNETFFPCFSLFFFFLSVRSICPRKPSMRLLPISPRSELHHMSRLITGKGLHGRLRSVTNHPGTGREPPVSLH